MYNDTIRAENKIISSDGLSQIFLMMGETLKKYQKISELEEQQNRMLDSSYQNYTFKDEGSRMKAIVDFYDNTNITFDKYENFASILYSRLDEIKRMDIYFTLSYAVITPEPNKRRDYYTQSIEMSISETKMSINLRLNSDDPKLNELYNLIKNVVINAPEKYDIIIKKRGSIMNTVSFALGIMPALVISFLLAFVPTVGIVFLKGYVVFPVCSVILAFIIGGVRSSKLDKYYEPILPEKKYAGYDMNKGSSVYKDDIDSYLQTSEILIGKKANNLANRQAIQEMYDKCKKTMPKALLALLVMSVVVIVLGFFM